MPFANTLAAEPKFEVVGNVCSLLQVSVPASWPLYTRRGTLVSVRGQLEDVITQQWNESWFNQVASTLSLLLQNPLAATKRIAFGIPYLYQKVLRISYLGWWCQVISKSQISATIATKAHFNSFVVVRLDGRIDWIISQKNALVAWTGPMLSPRPKIMLTAVDPVGAHLLI